MAGERGRHPPPSLGQEAPGNMLLVAQRGRKLHEHRTPGKGARVGIFGYGRDGHVDVDYARYDYGDEPGPGGRP